MALSRSISILRSPCALEEEVARSLCGLLDDPSPQVQVRIKCGRTMHFFDRLSILRPLIFPPSCLMLPSSTPREPCATSVSAFAP